MTPITAMSNERLLTMLPQASGVLRERIETVLRARLAGTQIKPMPCIAVTRDTIRALTYVRGNYSGARSADDGGVA